jgi:alkylation response protein AidB-like acyl-CoA dehydrogenase
MASFLDDNADLQYYLDKGVDWESLTAVTERGYRDPDGFKNGADALTFYREVAATVGKFAATEVAPFSAQLDRESFVLEDGELTIPPRLAAIFEKLGDLGLHGMNVPRELGGMNVPMLMYYINNELLARADVSVMAHHGFHGGTAMAMLVLSLREGTTEFDSNTGQISKTRWPEEIAEIATGEAWGSMDITEPDAGSDMSALRASATQDAEGNWSLTGEKIFITSGHGKYHFVIARTEKAASPDDMKSGLKGLSLFLVPAYEDGPDGKRTRLAEITRVEEKLGKHASATVALNFDRSPAQLVGKRGEGFRHMIEFMNHARLCVGFEAIGLCEAAVRAARAYATERRSMGKTIDRHEMIADYFSEMETDIVALRALAMEAAYRDELAQKLSLFGRFSTDDADEYSEARLRSNAAFTRRATPLLKYLASEKAVEITRRCLQIHGGNGYMKEFGAEKLLRDSIVLPIYEGTSQIQSLMAMKDTLGAIIKAPQAFLKRSAQTRWRALSARDELERRVASLKVVSLSAQQHLITQTVGAKVRSMRGKPLPTWRNELFSQWDPKRDFSFAMLHAERLTRILADEIVAEVLLSQARRHAERRPLLERYLQRAEPRARFLLDEITHSGDRTLAKSAEEGSEAPQAAE